MANNYHYQTGHSVQNVVSSEPYLSEYYSLYSSDISGSIDYNAHEVAMDSLIPTLTFQTNNSDYRNSNINISNNSDSDYTESRPSSTHLSENELGNNYSSTNLNDATYLLSLPNSNDWTLASSRNRHAVPSPASSSYTDSISSPMLSEMSFYDDIQTSPASYVPEGGRRTPPPPYRPPVNNIDISCDGIPLETISLKQMKPPPPYTGTQNSTTKYETFNAFSGFTGDSDISHNSPLTADQIQSAVATSGNWSMPPSPAEFHIGGFREQSAVKEDASREVLVPGDPELWNKDHIHHWLTRIENYYGIGPIDRTHLPADGVSLCRLSADDFLQITRDRGIAEIMSNYLHCLKQNVKFSSKSSEENSVKKEKKQTFFEAIKRVIGSSPRNKSLSSSGGQIQLWQFLLELLIDSKHSSLIAWEDEEGTFRLLDPEGTAKLWGKRKFNDMKSKKPMNYDKLSRSLRHYYMKGIVNKVYGRRYTYKFHLDGVLRACSPSGVSDSIFIYSNFDLNTCDKNSPRNFNLNVK